MVDFAGAAPGIANCAAACRVGKDWYELLNVPVGSHAGYDALGRILTLQNLYGQVDAVASQVTIFFRGAPPAAPLAVAYRQHGCAHGDRHGSQALPLQSRGLATVHPDPDCTSIDMNTIAVSESAPQPWF